MNLELDPAAPKNRKLLYWSLGGGAVLLVIIFAGVFSSQLGARLAPGLRFKILGPDKLIIGRSAIITWDTSPINKGFYPTEKIEFCPKPGSGQKCIVLAAKIPNNGRAVINKVPNMKPGEGLLRLTARAKNGQLLPHLTLTRSVRVIRLAVGGGSTPPSNDDGGSGGGGGGGGGGGSNSGGGSSTTPTAEFILPTDNEIVAAGISSDVRVKLTETTTNQLTCQQWVLDGQPLVTSDWVNGQSPDLSAGTCN